MIAPKMKILMMIKYLVIVYISTIFNLSQVQPAKNKNKLRILI